MMRLIAIILICFCVSCAAETIAERVNEYNHSGEILAIVQGKIPPINSPLGDPIDINNDTNSAVISRLLVLKKYLKDDDFDIIYNEFVPEVTKLRIWHDLLRMSANVSTGFSRYYPSLKDVKLNDIDATVSTILDLGGSGYTPAEVIELTMIRTDKSVDDLCRATFIAYLFNSKHACLKAIEDVKTNATKMLPSRRGFYFIDYGVFRLLICKSGAIGFM